MCSFNVYLFYYSKFIIRSIGSLFDCSGQHLISYLAIQPMKWLRECQYFCILYLRMWPDGSSSSSFQIRDQTIIGIITKYLVLARGHGMGGPRYYVPHSISSLHLQLSSNVNRYRLADLQPGRGKRQPGFLCRRLHQPTCGPGHQ